jgi:hypothetical protein
VYITRISDWYKLVKGKGAYYVRAMEHNSTFRSTWVHPRFLVGFVLLDLQFYMYVFVDRCLSFCTFSFGHCVVCSSSIYGFWLSLWYLQSRLPQETFVKGWVFLLTRNLLNASWIWTWYELVWESLQQILKNCWWKMDVCLSIQNVHNWLIQICEREGGLSCLFYESNFNIFARNVREKLSVSVH